MSQEFIEPFIDILEQARPINRVIDYNVLVSVISDMTGNETATYSNSDNNIFSKKVNYNFTLENTSIKTLSGSSTYTIKHNLASDYLNVQVFTSDLELIQPNTITHIDSNTLEIDFGYEVDAIILITKADSGYSKTDSSLPWIISHNYDNKYVISQFKDFSEEVIQPNEVIAIDENNLSVDQTQAVGMINTSGTVFIQSTEDTV
jgi:hypothetical protein